MSADAEPTSGPRWFLTPVGLLVIAVVSIWLIEIVDSVALGEQLQRNGIQPRRLAGLDGILWQPFLHSDYGHVASNSIPLLALGGLVAVGGMRYWSRVTLVTIVAGGALTWALGGQGNHIGASGLVFGYLGAILGAAVFERRPRALAPALLVLGFYSSMLAGVVPQDSISWESHLFGLIAGIGASRRLAVPRRSQPDRPDNIQPWEVDEPWLD
ncbi:rhomboid family intramembrane serine protease [Acidimicrobiaceae bacterium AH-315-P05]|nr:rhomboid family intramembrane serine protease [Acidimicrobiaceae bacterium AH-315-P05]